MKKHQAIFCKFRKSKCSGAIGLIKYTLLDDRNLSSNALSNDVDT